MLSLLTVATVAYCAAAVNFSWIHTWHNSDTVIPALISIERYSLFYWSENRFGMLVPLLASGIRDYGWNLLVQSQLIVLSGIGTILLIDALSSASSRARVLRVAAVALVLPALYKPQASLVLLLPGSPYLVSLVCLFAALYIHFRFQHRGHAYSLLVGLLFLLAFWVNASNAVMAVTAAVLWPAKDYANLRARVALLAIITAAAAVIWIASSQFAGTDIRQMLPLPQWPRSLFEILRNVQLTIRETLLAIVICGAAVLQTVRYKREKYTPVYAIAAAAVCQIIVTSGVQWVALNGYDSRYISGPLFVLATVSMLSLSAPISRAVESAAGAGIATVAGCLLAMLVTTQIFGFPSPQTALAGISSATSDVAAPPAQLACTHIVGNYWYAWETVFNSRLRTGETRLWAVTHRSDATRDAWTAIPIRDRRYCAVCGDPQVEHMRRAEGVGHLTKEAELNGICVFRELGR